MPMMHAQCPCVPQKICQGCLDTPSEIHNLAHFGDEWLQLFITLSDSQWSNGGYQDKHTAGKDTISTTSFFVFL